MTTIQFWVGDALPPRKVGANSMWSNRTETARLVALRRAAKRVMNGSAPLRKNVRMRITVYPKETDLPSAADLDGFVSGLWHGLKSAPPGARLAAPWRDPHLAYIHPSSSVALAEDAVIAGVSLDVVPANRSRPMYRVSLESMKETGDLPMAVSASIHQLPSVRGARGRRTAHPASNRTSKKRPQG